LFQILNIRRRVRRKSTRDIGVEGDLDLGQI